MSRRAAAAALLAGVLAGCSGGGPLGSGPRAPSAGTGTGGPATATPVAAAPAADVYGHAGRNMLAPVARAARALVYVPDSMADRVDVIDPRTYRVIRSFRVGREPQHVVPSWDLRTLWVNDDRGNSLVPIDPRTGRPGRPVRVADPYNLYFTPDGRAALVMAERLHRIDVRDPHTMALRRSLHVPCAGINHVDFAADLTWFVASCEFSGQLLLVSADASRLLGRIDLNRIRTPGAGDPMAARMSNGPGSSLRPGATSMPQDVRLSTDGRTFLVADMLRNGVWLVDAGTRRVRRFVHTGAGAHGIYPSRDGRRFFVSDRDGNAVSVLDARTLRVVARWPIPHGGTPDMGGVSVDGSQLWLSGRYSGVVYVFDTRTGRLLHRIKVGAGPHGLCVWPQPGRFSLGHTGNMR